MKNGFIIMLLSLISVNAVCQQEKTSEILFKLSSDSVLKTGDGSLFEVLTLKYYISDVQLLNKDNIVFQETNSFHLIDLRDIYSCKFSLTHPAELQFNYIRFNLGVDSITNVSGAFGGDLDPVNGMYWTWQSGYINFKLEGTIQHADGQKKELEFHLGGYQFPYNNLQNIKLPLTDQNNIVIKFNLEQLLLGIDTEETNHIMSPGPPAQFLSGKLAKCFTGN